MHFWTIGHSVRPVDALIDLLAANEIDLLFDVRRYPMSRRNPQFNSATLAAALGDRGIAYRHAPDLGGRREPLPDSPNQALRNDQFRGYADYMATPDFDATIGELIAEASTHRVAVMCAEAVPWRCHRGLLADALLARGHRISHIIDLSAPREHTLSPHAVVGPDGGVSYPALL